MRLLKSLLFIASLAAIGCGGNNTTNETDLGPLCDPAAEAPNTLKCQYGVDQTCRSQFGYDCRCLCTGYWECDLVMPICGGDLGSRD